MTEDRESVLCRGEPLKEPVVPGAEFKVRTWTVHVTEVSPHSFPPCITHPLFHSLLLSPSLAMWPEPAVMVPTLCVPCTPSSSLSPQPHALRPPPPR
jgi:hypothetical protein